MEIFPLLRQIIGRRSFHHRRFLNIYFTAYILVCYIRRLFQRGHCLLTNKKQLIFVVIEKRKVVSQILQEKNTMTKIDITLGYICEKHTEEIIKYYGSEYLKEFQYVIDRNWIGSIKKEGSVAYNLKHIFKFNINKNSGFNKNRWERMKEKISEEFYKIPGSLLFEILKLVITVLVTYWLVKLGLANELK